MGYVAVKKKTQWQYFGWFFFFYINTYICSELTLTHISTWFISLARVEISVVNTTYTVAFLIKTGHILLYTFCAPILTKKTSVTCTFHILHFGLRLANLHYRCMIVFVWDNVGLCQTTALPLITNQKRYWTMIKCSPVRQLIMLNSLSRLSWNHFSGPSGLPGAPWTSWNMWPQWLPPSLPLNPAEQFTPVQGQTSRSELSHRAGEGMTSLCLTHWPLLFTLW